MRRVIRFAAAVVAVLVIGAEVPAADCACGPGCKCPAGQCPAACPKPDGPAAAEIVARCRRGEVFVRAVGAGEVPGVPAGLYLWRQVPDGRIRWDRVSPPAGAVSPPVIRFAPANPFAPPACPTCVPGRR